MKYIVTERGSEYNDEYYSLNENGYIKADERMHTSVEGLFACGDVQDFKYRQAITAAASGCIAGIESSKYVSKF